MGFSKKRSASGKGGFSCAVGIKDHDHPSCQGHPCRAHHCPFGWCKRYYICEVCWSRPDIKALFSEQAHEHCRVSQAAWAVIQLQRRTILASGAYLRCRAREIDNEQVHVLFENQLGETIGKYMNVATYDAYSWLENQTVEDYARIGRLVNAPSTFE